MSNLPEKTLESLPDELLLIILELISDKEDLLSCRLVCKKWLNIVSKRVRLVANTSVYYFISNYRHELFTNFRTVNFDSVKFSAWPVHFKSVLQHCEKLHFRDCSFKNAKGLKNCILSCTGLKFFEMSYCGFRLGVLESILNDKKLKESNNTMIETLKLSFFTSDWPLIRVFDAIGVRVNKLELGIYMDDDFMETLNFVKQTYGTKLKSLEIKNFKAHNIVLQFLIDWEGLKLENIVLFGPYNNPELVEKFLEQQTALKELECWVDTNTDKYPMSLEKITLKNIAANGFDEKLQQLSKRVPNLKSLHLYCLWGANSQIFDLSFLSRLKHMQDFECGGDLVQIHFTTPDKLNSINRLSLSNVMINDKTMKDIIQNMPNLDHLSLNKVQGLTHRPFADLSSLGKLRILELPREVPIEKELIDNIYLPCLRRLAIKLEWRSPNIQISTPAANFPRLRKVYYLR